MEKPVYEIPISDREGGFGAMPNSVGSSQPLGGAASSPSLPAVPNLSTFAPPDKSTVAPQVAPPAAAAPPVFDAPVFNAPVFDAPVYDAPVFGAPVFDSPAFDIPVADAGVYQTPQFPTTGSFSMPVSATGHAAIPAPAPEPGAPQRPVVPPFADELPTPTTTTAALPITKVEEDHGAALLEALREVLLRAASDLHISAGAPPMLRIDGALSVVGDGQPWSREKVRSTLTSLLSPLERDRFEANLELDFAYTLTSNARFRVNYYQDRGSMGAAFRIIPNEITQLADLGVPAQVANFAALRRGLVLVTGPTGSGKSTTLAALIDLVNTTRTDHIVTVEDPIEFLHRNKKSLVHQREVGRDTHSFSSALKHVLRQDPDVILIGELRDLETISTALTAAETGHLVFATLHTQDAPQTIDRLIDVFPPHQQAQVRAQVASTLQGVISQTLVKSANGPGRVVATEVLITTPAVSNLIREGKLFQIRSAMHAGRDLGMHTMDQHLADLVAAGKVTPEAALEKAQDSQALTQMLSSLGVSFTSTHS